jgi:excisionase family DNA binding protein
MSRYVSPVVVAARLGVSRATAHRLIAAGVIPAVVLIDRPGRRLLRVSEEALESALGRRRARPEPLCRAESSSTQDAPPVGPDKTPSGGK